MSNSPYLIEALVRGLEVLGLFSNEQPSLTMTDIVKLTGHNKTTIYRILSTLQEAGYLNRNPETKKYQPSLKVLGLGFTAINQFGIRQIAHPHLERITHDLKLSGSLGILDNLSVIYVDRIRNRAIVGVLLGLGDRIPAHCSSMGKVMLAHQDPNELQQSLHLSNLQPCTPRSIKTEGDLLIELEKVKHAGYAINDGELSGGLRAIAAPIFDNQGRVVAAINVSGSQDEIDDIRLYSQLPDQIIQTAQMISEELSIMGL